MLKSLLDALADLAQSRLLGIIINRVSARNSSSLDLARLGKRPSGGRGGGDGAIRGDIASQLPPHMYLDTARFDGHKTLEHRECG